jgi:hypothetical protein
MLMQLNAAAQSKSGIENYNFLSSREAYVWMPLVHHVSKKGVYTELRYNYEAVNAASLYLGKSFTKEGTIKYTLTPMLGLVMGSYNGGSLALNMELEHKKTFVSMQTQYTVSSDDVKDNFFFNWTEIGYQPLKWLYAGVSTQQTVQYGGDVQSEYGILTGFVIKKFTIPVYVFNPLNKNRNFIIGINTEW